jgi:hypothetical protein
MKHFQKVDVKLRNTQKERGQYAIMKRNQRKASRRQAKVATGLWSADCHWSDDPKNQGIA